MFPNTNIFPGDSLPTQRETACPFLLELRYRNLIEYERMRRVDFVVQACRGSRRVLRLKDRGQHLS